MCGIFGITLRRRERVGAILKRALKHLEYRGYDSVGIAVTDGKRVEVRKDVGFVDMVAELEGFDLLEGIAGIGHTRWATHGGVSKENAHPHADCEGTLFIVHNGIIENYREIKEWLISRGHVFRSETDSEVIAHLFEEFGADERGLKEVLKVLTGSYAFVALRRDGALLCARRGSPLVVGRFEGGVAVASDPVPLLEYTKKVLRLGEGEYCIAKGSELIYGGRSREKVLSWSPSSLNLGSYAHYMEKEIEEQPAVIRRLASWLKEKRPRIRLRGSVHIIGAGTSFHASLYGEYVLSKRGKSVRAFLASEYPYWNAEEPDIVIAVSQSGETADVLSALQGFEGEIIAITNNPTSTLASISDEVILLNAGPELGVAATKTYTAQLFALYYLATGRLPENVPSLLYETIVRSKPIVEEIGRILKDRRSVYYLGRGINVVTAMEGALKLKEVAYVHAEAYPAGESKHGPIALVERGFPTIFIMPRDSAYRDALSNLEEMRARGATVITVSSEPPREDVLSLPVPLVEDSLLYPLITVVPLQMLAYKVAVLRGLNPDRPRNLAKSVTVK